MGEEFLMAYRVVDIDQLLYFVVFPVPRREEIEKANFSYPEYRKNLLAQITKLPPEERLETLNAWASPKEIKPYDIAIGKIQIAYEQALQTGIKEEDLPDIYTGQMKQVIEEYKRSVETRRALQKEENLKKKLEEINKTRKDRFASILNGETTVTSLYIGDIKGMNKNYQQREFKRFFFAHLDMGIQEELTELELETMTLQEIWDYNKEYLGRKSEKHSKRKICPNNKKIV